MAYNPNMYNPYGQTALWTYQPNSSQPVNGLVSVTGIDGAKAYQLPPNSSMPLFDANNDIMYLKTTDGAGFPTIRAFRFEAIESEQRQNTEYVPRSEFDALVEQVRGLVNGKQLVPEAE